MEKSLAEGNSDEERGLAYLCLVGLDLLILSYALAEGMHRNATEHYSDLRTGRPNEWLIFKRRRTAFGQTPRQERKE